MDRSSRYLGSAAALAGVLAMASPASADRAIVVGVNNYTNLQGANLGGCVNDAKMMAETLRARGFDVMELYDRRATKSEILTSLSNVRKQIKPTERFVFYFAGHGTDTTEGDKAALLPSDTLQTSAQNDLKANELYQAVRQIQAVSRNVVLDSCFSGGMLVSTRSLGRTTRYFARSFSGAGGGALGGAGTKDLRVTPVNNQNTNTTVSAGGGEGVCYYTAARGNEQANEEVIGGERHGVFTYYFVGAIKDPKTRLPWGQVNSQVAQQVADRLKDLQHPTLSPDFADVRLFEGRASKAVQTTSTLWDDFHKDNPDPSRVTLTMTPNATTVTVLKDNLSFHATANSPGWMLILERGTSGKINLLFPMSREIGEARVEAGKTVSIPGEGLAFQADAPGNERVKVFLFSTQEQAQKWLSNFPKEGAERNQLRDLLRVQKTQPAAFYTADFIFEAIDPSGPAGLPKPNRP